MTLPPLQQSQQPSQPSQQSTLTVPHAENIPSSSPAPDLNTDRDTVCGWLVLKSTFETCLVIHRDKTATIGRHTSCDMILVEKTISNIHCKFSTKSAGVVLCEDMSTNGTYWNGHLIGKGESVFLSHGDSIRIRGSHHLVFQDLMKAKPEHEDPEIAVVERAYQVLPRTLGKGTFAKVHVAIHRKTKVQLAVKIMDRVRFGAPEYSGGTDIEKEVAILQSADHANIVPVVDTIKTTRYIYIFMQMMIGGDLFDHILRSGPLPELEAKFIAYQTLQALQHLHAINISHRDLKPENLLLTSAAKYPRILLTDFGMAREFGKESLMNTMCGTFAYMAPEVFDVKHAQGPGYGNSADCWSLGVTLYVILSGTHPFTSKYATEDEKTMRDKMRSGNLMFPARYWKEIGPEVRVLIQNLLAIDPSRRWNVEDALASEWIQKDVAWLRQRYRETVVAHWIKSSQNLEPVLRHVATTTPLAPVAKRARYELALSDYELSRRKRVLDETLASSRFSSLQAMSSLPDTTMRVPDAV